MTEMAETMGGGETKRDPSGWTVDTLHVMMNQRFHDLDLRLQQRFDAQQAALEEKNDTLQARLENLNEFRGQQRDMIATLLPRGEAEARFAAIEAVIAQRFDQIDGKVDSSVAQRREAIALINSRLDLQAGAGAGITKAWGIVVAAVVATASAVGMIVIFSR